MANEKSPSHELMEQIFALTDEGVRKALKKKFKSGELTEQQVQCVIADNLMKVAFEVMFSRWTPFEAELVPEIACRSAAIALTALPEEARAWGSTTVAMSLHEAVERKTAGGFSIGTVWDDRTLN